MNEEDLNSQMEQTDLTIKVTLDQLADISFLLSGKEKRKRRELTEVRVV
jgi:hypothetical protein